MAGDGSAAPKDFAALVAALPPSVLALAKRVSISNTTDLVSMAGSGLRSAISGMPTCAFGASLAAHAILFLALATATPRIPGAEGRAFDAVGVDIVDASALDGLLSRRMEAAAPAVSPEYKPAAPMTPPAEAVPRQQLAAADRATPLPSPVIEARPPLAAVDETSQPLAQAAMGPLAQRYALTVREAIGRVRPRHLGAKGQVQVAFGLTTLGAVRFAEVTRTSGVAKLDEAAIKAVHSASFPTPPEGLGERHLSFVVPFNFR